MLRAAGQSRALTPDMNEDRLPIILSPEADRDLLDIWAHLSQEISVAIADKQLREIKRLCLAISDWPEYGRAREDVRKGMRSAPIGRYVVFYRPTRDAIELVRVLDERRDVDAIFRPGDDSNKCANAARQLAGLGLRTLGAYRRECLAGSGGRDLLRAVPPHRGYHPPAPHGAAGSAWACHRSRAPRTRVTPNRNARQTGWKRLRGHILRDRLSCSKGYLGNVR
jgi:toxin ParE1/3/4